MCVCVSTHTRQLEKDLLTHESLEKSDQFKANKTISVLSEPPYFFSVLSFPCYPGGLFDYPSKNYSSKYELPSYNTVWERIVAESNKASSDLPLASFNVCFPSIVHPEFLKCKYIHGEVLRVLFWSTPFKLLSSQKSYWKLKLFKLGRQMWPFLHHDEKHGY